MPGRLDELVAEAGASDVLEANRRRSVGSQTKPGELLSVCNALPFMDGRRLVVVEGLLGKAESQGRGRRRGASGGPGGEPDGAGQWQDLGDAIPLMPESTVLVFTDGPLSANNPLLRLLRPVAQV